MIRGKSIKSRRSIHPIFIDKLFGVTDIEQHPDQLKLFEKEKPD